MAYSNQVAIGPEFFAKAFYDYSDWYWAIIREFFQNSADAKCYDIVFDITAQDGNTILSVRNNGRPMDRETLVGKLLALGGSGKNFEGSVGGFGKAKEILYFAHKSYNIRTGNLIVEGCGAGYNISETTDHYQGTSSTIVLNGNHTQKLIDAVCKFTSYTQWDGVVLLNNTHYSTNLRKGSYRRDISCGKIYTNKSFSNKLIVRMNGIPMFWSYIGLDKCVILELNGKSSECLTSNRDGLSGSYQRELYGFITSLSTNTQSALRSTSVTYTHYEGKKFQHINSTSVKEMCTALVGEGAAEHAINEDRSFFSLEGFTTDSKQSLSKKRSALPQEFLIKNTTGMTIPKHFLPDSYMFSSYSKKLASSWGNLLSLLHTLFDANGCFSIGFVFDDDVEALFERTQMYGTVYFINPAKIVQQRRTSGRSFKKRFSLVEKNRLLMIALHEFIHGLGMIDHDEKFSTKLTNMAWMVMDKKKLFNSCFKV